MAGINGTIVNSLTDLTNTTINHVTNTTTSFTTKIATFGGGFVYYIQKFWFVFVAIIVLMVFFYVMRMRKRIRLTLGSNQMFDTLASMNMLKHKGYILLKISQANGTPQYIPAVAEPILKYKYRLGDEEKASMVIYDSRAVYNDFNMIPIMNVSPNEILPLNPFSASRLPTNPQVALKYVVEGAKTHDQKNLWDAIPKIAIYIILGLIAVVIVGYIFFAQSNLDIVRECQKPITIVQPQGQQLASDIGAYIINTTQNLL